ncbi:hypothetical protein CPB83DRAFT_368238 [Crepidotus variabilis]|uniref:Uncharacterized protein n=1 Tax=Crepidotus variabilis TaxID=179855 RepID=A0A9P6JNX5_9AGAR|nr:hypothetical protein CPB83DRAFT_368238 [Crepidotus variabilis]
MGPLCPATIMHISPQLVNFVLDGFVEQTVESVQNSSGIDSTYPDHHRDDAIAGLPPNQLNEIQDSANEGYQAPQPPFNGTYGTGPQSNTMESQGATGLANNTQKYQPPPTHPDNLNQGTGYYSPNRTVN